MDFIMTIVEQGLIYGILTLGIYVIVAMEAAENMIFLHIFLIPCLAL